MMMGFSFLVWGDFGRTPRINKQDGGRDHWNNCYTIMLVGGGFKQGFVYGASDRIGGLPITNPITPGDIIATFYHLVRQLRLSCLGLPQLRNHGRFA